MSNNYSRERDMYNWINELIQLCKLHKIDFAGIVIIHHMTLDV